MIFSVPLGEPVYPRSRSIKRAIGLTLVFSSRVFSTSQLHLIACESSLQRSNWLTFFIEFPSMMMVMPFFFFEGVSEGLFCLSPPFFVKNSCLPPPSVLLHRHRSKFFTFSGTTGRTKERFRDSFIHRVEYPKRGRKYPHTTQRRGLSLLFSSLLSSLETQRRRKRRRRRRRRRKRCITDTRTNTPRTPC